MGLTHTLFPTERDKVGVHCDMMKWLYLFCKRSGGWFREIHRRLFSVWLPFFLCVSCTTWERRCLCVCVSWCVCDCWACAQQRERESVSLDHPVEAVPKKRNKYCVCVCVLCKTVSISRLESLPLGFSLSTVIHRALTSEDRHFFTTGCPSLQNPQLINFDCFLCQLCLSDVKL